MWEVLSCYPAPLVSPKVFPLRWTTTTACFHWRAWMPRLPSDRPTAPLAVPPPATRPLMLETAFSTSSDASMVGGAVWGGGGGGMGGE